MTSSPEFAGRLASYRSRIETVLDGCLALPDSGTARLREAMRYSALGGGKRLRPSLVYLTGESLGAPLEELDSPAAAVELIHVYSLVHDDLPAMDDDDLRRGRPTCHRAFDEATAILVGDALQALAFAVLADDTKGHQNPAARLAMIRVLAQATGTSGMAGGQAVDLAAVGQNLTVADVENMHRRKTGALIEGSVLLGALARTISSTLKATRRCSANPPEPMLLTISPRIRARRAWERRVREPASCATMRSRPSSPWARAQPS
jgi:geranylgeranyl pyrophosphate synthase